MIALKTVSKSQKNILRKISSFSQQKLKFGQFYPQLKFEPTQLNQFCSAQLNQQIPKKIMQNQFQNQCRFNLSVDDIQQQTDEQIKIVSDCMDQIVAVQGERNFENTIRPHADCLSEFANVCTNLTFIGYVSEHKEIRDAGMSAEEKIDKYYVDLQMREDLYNAFKKFKVDSIASGEFEKLDAESQRYVERNLRKFERNGLNLELAVREKITEIQKELSAKSTEFSKNQNEDKSQVEFTREELNGLSDDFINGLKKVDGKENSYYVTMKYPDLLPALKLANNEQTRQKLDFAQGTKNLNENNPLLQDTVILRQKLAQILGFKSYADYTLEVKMAKNPSNVENFLSDLTQKLIPAGQKELQILQELKQRLTNDNYATFNSWDFSYYNNKLKEEKYQVDDQKIKEYFPMEHVVASTLEVYQKLLSLSFKEIENPHVWHQEVKLYAVYQADDHEFLGHFYLDLFPRDGKYGHAAVFPMIKRAIVRGKLQHSVAAMVCNFTKPTAEKPSLLLHSEVNTFFHEFGHVMHNICTKCNYGMFSGTSVERDFVECPSQILENWTENKEILQIISSHYLTKEPLPNNLIDSIIAAKNLNVALLTLRQIFFGTYDMILHTNKPKEEWNLDTTQYNWDNLRALVKYDGERIDTGDLWAQLRKIITLLDQQKGTNPAADFGHIMGGYEAGYYGYLWSEVFSCDLFSRFEQEGLLNPVVGKEYREKILAPGGSVDSIDAIVSFLGRQPKNDQFLKQRGIN